MDTYSSLSPSRPGVGSGDRENVSSSPSTVCNSSSFWREVHQSDDARIISAMHSLYIESSCGGNSGQHASLIPLPLLPWCGFMSRFRILHPLLIACLIRRLIGPAHMVRHRRHAGKKLGEPCVKSHPSPPRALVWAHGI